MIYILSVEEIRSWDSYTIANEPIEAIQLMERAASRCSAWIMKRWNTTHSFSIFCGNGNNGGDGLAVARHLLQNNYEVSVYIDDAEKRSHDNQTNLHELQYLYPSKIFSINEEWQLGANQVIIDALFGIGVNKEVIGKEQRWIERLNQCSNYKISIDMPSGLAADIDLQSTCVVQADCTLTFQCYKKTFLFAETGQYCGQVNILDIGLDHRFLQQIKATNIVISKELLKSFYSSRKAFSHKGTYGHSLLIAGSSGKMGAAVLASKGCLRAGTGLLTVLVPKAENPILQNAVPEAMTVNYDLNHDVPSLDPYNSIGIGPGLGQGELAKSIFVQLLSVHRSPLILDADALNIIAHNKELFKLIPEGSLLTPHVKEFDRLFGTCINAMARFTVQKQKSKELGVIILLKGRYTCITTPGGVSYFNTTGNAGMASGGSGDVLTGILTGLYAQYNDMFKAALLGVYLHGLAGDISVRGKESMESLLASDLAANLGLAFKELTSSGDD